MNEKFILLSYILCKTIYILSIINCCYASSCDNHIVDDVASVKYFNVFCSLISIPTSIPKNATEIHINNNEILTLKGLNYLVNNGLETLKIQHNNISEIPNDVWAGLAINATNLIEFDISYNKISQVPDLFVYERLDTLNLEGNQIKTFLPDLSATNGIALETLNLRHNGLEIVSMPFLHKADHLKRIYLEYNNIKSFEKPNDFRDYGDITEARLDNNKLDCNRGLCWRFEAGYSSGTQKLRIHIHTDPHQMCGSPPELVTTNWGDLNADLLGCTGNNCRAYI